MNLEILVGYYRWKHFCAHSLLYKITFSRHSSEDFQIRSYDRVTETRVTRKRYGCRFSTHCAARLFEISYDQQCARYPCAGE